MSPRNSFYSGATGSEIAIDTSQEEALASQSAAAISAAAALASQLAAEAALTSLLANGSIDIIDEDDMVSDTDIKAPSQQSTKAYVLAQSAATLLSLTHFHSSIQEITSSEELTNSTTTVDLTFSELTNARHYAVYLNRALLRPNEYSVSGSTLTVSIGVLLESDEVEVTGLAS
jgi:hypothetical protein